VRALKYCDDVTITGGQVNGKGDEHEQLKPNSITLSGSKLVADMFEAGRLQASNLSATSFERASNQLA